MMEIFSKNTIADGWFLAAFAIMAFLCVLLFLLLIKQNRRLLRAERRYQTLTRGIDGVDWNRMLEKIDADTTELVLREQQAEGEIVRLIQRADKAFCKQGMVHYDAFPNISGRLSFSLALLDSKHNGFVLSNVHGREDARCYLKEVVNGTITTYSSPEEVAAVEMAMQSKREGKV